MEQLDFDAIADALDLQAKRPSTIKEYLRALDELTALFVGRELCMVHGRVVPRAHHAAIMASVCELGAHWLAIAASMDLRKARRWLAVATPAGRVPRSVQVSSVSDEHAAIRQVSCEQWWSAALEQSSPAIAASQPAARIDLDDKRVSSALATALRGVLALPASDGERAAPVGDDAIARRADQLGCEIPDDVAVLYRTCNGFSLFGGKFRFVALAELRTFADWSGDERPSRKRGTRSLAQMAEDPARLRVFDLGNGDFVSCASNARHGVVWIDDWREMPSPLACSLAQLLTFAIDPKRRRTGAWQRDGWTGVAPTKPTALTKATKSTARSRR